MIKIHIDHIDNEDGRVWAVQDGKKYYRVHEVHCYVNLFSQIRKKQPKAYLEGKGKVYITNVDNLKIAVIR